MTDPHRATLDRFLNAPDVLVEGREVPDSEPLDDLYEHGCGDACEGQCRDETAD